MDRDIKKRVLALGASACLLCSGGAFAAEPAQNPNTAAPAAVAGAQSQNVAASKTVYVKIDLNVHEQPDASSKVLGTLKKDTAVVVTEEKYGWYTITFNGQTGYISAKYTTETDPSTPIPTPTPTPETKTVYTTENLKVRAQPNTSAEVLGTLKKGTKVETYGLKDGWYEIKYEGKTGYISAKYTTETDPSTPTPTPTPETKTVYTTENLKVRAQPNTSAEVLGTLKKGTKVETYGLKDGWYEIKYEGKTGYISAKYTTETDPSTPTPTPTPETKTVYTTENLKVRAQPNTSAEVLGTLKKGTKIETYGLKDGWYEIKYEGKTGYISAKYTTETDPSTPQPSPSPVLTVYTKEDLRVRAKPDNTSTVLGVLKKGTAVETLDEINGWYLIKYNNQDGYISKAYTTTEKPAAPTVKFTDVSKDDWFYEPVMWAVSNNITAGVSENKFAPNQTCTRAQAVMFLWNQAGKPVVSRKNTFKDVKRSDWYYNAVQWAVSEGITNGTSKTTFSPSKTCNRAEIVTFLWNQAGKPSVSASNPFKDVKSSDWYYKAVQWAVKKGVTSGTSKTTFSPTKACTRAQIVTFMYHNQ